VAGHIGVAAERVIEARVKQWWRDRLVPVPESALAGRRAINTHSFVPGQTRRTPRRTIAGDILYGRRTPTAAHCGQGDLL